MTSEKVKVAIKHYNSNPFNVKVGYNTYAFTPRFNISMAWVEAEDVEKILAVSTNRCRSCHGVPALRFSRASVEEIKRWETGE